MTKAVIMMLWADFYQSCNENNCNYETATSMMSEMLLLLLIIIESEGKQENQWKVKKVRMSWEALQNVSRPFLEGCRQFWLLRPSV